ncbi:MAG: isoleucine--tRNA ligase [archaeon]|nr:MAG: isoleucine--tRNA ligase [archaeon]
MYKPQEVEKEILEFWEKNRIFEKLVEKNGKSRKNFRFIDGPITANNPMGVHHAYARTLKDIYQRYRALQGFRQRFQNGFDCHGLPVEVEVEKELGLETKKDIEEYGLENFIQKCRERVEKMAKVQTEQSVRLGQWMDWEKSYYTMDDSNIEHIWHFLKKCHQNGWITKGHRVLPWCIRCGTSLSQHEIGEGYKELTHDTVFLKFPIKGRKEYLLVWTTTPWTLTSNVAAAVNPDVTYFKVRKSGVTYYLSGATAEILGDYELLGEIKGKDLVGWEYKGPYDELDAQRGVVHKVVPWNEVGEEDGTGIVHIAPGCGAEDFELGQKLGLPAIAPLDEYGYYIEGFNWLTGKNVTEVMEPIIEDLDKKGMLYGRDKIKHRYPTCWRCKEELIFRMTDAWFIKVDDIRERMIREAKRVMWSPEFGGKLMNDWLSNMGDWNISRKRYWGLPLPFWECDCGELIVIENRKELEQKAVSGMDDLKDLHKPQIDKVVLKCPECGKEVKRIEEVGDCWLDAGIVPYSTLKYMTDREYWKEWFPAELISEMREQVRLWFYSLLFMSVTLEDKTPYEKVLLFEKVYDEKGQEMHKSGKNVIWFDEAIEKMGADVMRWMYIKTNTTQNVLFGYSPAKEITKNLDYLVNLGKYVKKFLVNPGKKFKDLEKEDVWLISRLESIKKIVKRHMEELNPFLAAKAMEDFFINDFSRIYVKLVRNRLKGEKDVAVMMYYALLDTLKLMSPFTPFITENIYQDLFRKNEKTESIHLLEWPEADEKKIDKKLERNFAIIQKISEAANSIRQEKNVGLRYPVKELTVSGPEEVRKAVKELEDVLKEMCNTKKVKFGELSVEYTVKLNYSKVGSKYGKDVKEIEKALEKEDKPKLVKEVREKGSVDLKSFKLSDEDLVIEMASKEGKEFRLDKIRGTVALDLEETREIFEESLVREFIRNVQQTRKEMGLMVEDRIKIKLECDKDGEKIIKKWKKIIGDEVGSEKIDFGKVKGGKVSEYKNKKVRFELEVLK